jgi:hypothetical protein
VARATYVLEVDWNNDGDFDDSYEDCTRDFSSIECRRGRDYASQLVGKASPGRLVAVLRNRDGLYSSYNTASPLYGSILPGRKVRLRTTSPSVQTLWTGYLNRLLPSGDVFGIPTAMMEATGALGKLTGKEVTPEKQEAQTTGYIIGVLLDEVSWPAGERSIDTGQTEVDTWFTSKKDVLSAIREVEETELGFLYESEGAAIVFEDRHHRLKSPHTASQATFSDVSGDSKYIGIGQADPLADIYNEVFAMIQKYTKAGSSEILWALSGETPTVEAGASVEYWAEYPNVEHDSEDGAYVDTWDTPVVGVDITQTGGNDGDIGVVVSKFANSMKITITNNRATTITLTLVQVKGTKVTKNSPVKLHSEDTTSQGRYGIRTYKLPAIWLQNTNTGKDYTNYLVSRYKDPMPVLSLSFKAIASDNNMIQALERNISDRITVVATSSRMELGIDADFFIEAIQHKISIAGQKHDVIFELSDAAGDGGYWVLGVSELGVTTKLAY